MLAWLSDLHTWLALLEIIGVNVVLSGDNAVVIALACRSLPAAQQRQAIFFGSLGAIVLRALLTAFAALLLNQAYLKLIGGALLLWIAIKLLLEEEDGSPVECHDGMWAAIKTIVVADLVMSLDNVLGVAAVAKGDVVLLVLGLLISMPLIIYGSTVIMKLMSRFPMLITLGAALLGYIAAEMSVSDQAIVPWLAANMPWLSSVAPIVGAVLVVVTARALVHRRQR
ncbi:MAG: TerC family protein [Gammaproteobacteria bacterium]|nr:TerC family protein [Gammaproteobacteria bacterium]